MMVRAVITLTCFLTLAQVSWERLYGSIPQYQSLAHREKLQERRLRGLQVSQRCGVILVQRQCEEVGKHCLEGHVLFSITPERALLSLSHRYGIFYHHAEKAPCFGNEWIDIIHTLRNGFMLDILEIRCEHEQCFFS